MNKVSIMKKLCELFNILSKISKPCECYRSDLLKIENLIIDLLHDDLGITIDEGKYVESYRDLIPSARVHALLKYGSKERVEKALNDFEEFEADEEQYTLYINDDVKVSDREWKLFMQCIAEFIRERIPYT